MAYTVKTFEAAVLKARRAVYGDSNDREIEALQDAVSQACVLLKVDEQAIVATVEAETD